MREYEYFLILLVTAAVTYLLTPLVRKTAIRIGAVPAARDRDVHVEPIPRMGGLAMYFGVAAGLLAATQIGSFRSVIGSNAPDLVNGLLFAGGLIVVIGIIDDRWGMNSIAKAAGQVAAAGVLVHSGAQLSFFPLPKDGAVALTNNEGVVLTILVVVATINAVNFIDGLDGLAAGIVFIAAISFFIYYYSLTKVVGLYGVPAAAVPALASVVIAGACLGFLPHNFHPARIFMGDTGSMLLGLLLACVPISALSAIDPTSLQNRANRFPEILPLLLPAAVMVIPYTDMLRAVIRRMRAGQSPFAPDNKHLHHRMLEIGHSHRSSVLILYAWAALFAAVVVGLSIVTAPLVVLAGTTLAAVLVLVLLSIPRLRWWERRPVPAAPQPRPAVTPRPPVVDPEPRGDLAGFRVTRHALGNGGTSAHRMAESVATLPSPPEANVGQEDLADDDPAETAPMQVPRRASGSIIP
ncbi:MAG TPA: MraY family glycosyltransferase [Streptosporangiaceae bacterium]|nr:MraY family glycosyltransferase [Streptosporangiaceae bacterium]